MVLAEDRKVTLDVWQDLGAGTSFADPYGVVISGMRRTTCSKAQNSAMSMEASITLVLQRHSIMSESRSKTIMIDQTHKSRIYNENFPVHDAKPVRSILSNLGQK